MTRGINAGIVGVVLVSFALGACGGTDAEPGVGEAIVASDSSASVSIPRDRLAPDWAPHRLSADGRTLTIGVRQPCGSQWEDLEVSVDESADEVLIDVTVIEISATGCESAGGLELVDSELTRPLGDRPVVDRRDPARALVWTVAPGSVQARVVIESAPEAVAVDVPDDLFLAIGIDVPMIPLSIDQVRSGMVMPMPITFDPGVQRTGVYGFIERLPLVPESYIALGSLPISAPDPLTAFQDLVITLAPGAVGADGRTLVVDSDKVTLSWRTTPEP